jgi:hypothetical protein
MDRGPFLIMKKILYIFLAHVVVLGSIWLWKDREDEDYPGLSVLHEPGQPVSLMVMNNDAEDFRIIICLNKDELGSARPGQIFNISMFTHEDETGPWHADYQIPGVHTCYNVRLNESDPGCVVLTSGKESLVE